MDLTTWFLFLLTEAALCLTPGPAVLYVASQGLSRGFRASFAANLGIVTGNTIYFIASALGVGALILASHQVFFAVKWIGVAYLIWLGLRMLMTKEDRLADAAAPVARTHQVYRAGVVVQLANPKNMVFFVAILPPFIDLSGNVPLQVLILGVTSQTVEVLVLMFYGGLASKAGPWLRASRAAAWVDRVAGSTLILIGAGLAFVRRAGP